MPTLFTAHSPLSLKYYLILIFFVFIFIRVYVYCHVYSKVTSSYSKLISGEHANCALSNSIIAKRRTSSAFAFFSRIMGTDMRVPKSKVQSKRPVGDSRRVQQCSPRVDRWDRADEKDVLYFLVQYRTDSSGFFKTLQTNFKICRFCLR